MNGYEVQPMQMHQLMVTFVSLDFLKIIFKIYIISCIRYFVGKGSEEAIQMLKKAEAANEESPFGELTQRLVAGLLEENAINQNDLEESTKKGKNIKDKQKKPLGI